jgi:hypothetical protein
MKKILLLFLTLISLTIYSQNSYEYSYIEPCSGKLKSLSVPIGAVGSNVTVNYYGSVSTFNSVDFNNGNFQNWMNLVSGSNTNQPCGQIATILTNDINMTVTQNVITTVVGVANITSMMSDVLSDVAGGGVSTNLANALDNSENVSSGDSKKEVKNNSGESNGSSVNSSSNSGNTTSSSSTNGSSVNSSSTTNNPVSSTNGGSTSTTNNPVSSSTTPSSSGGTSNSQSTGSGSSSTANAVSNSEDNSSGGNKKDKESSTSASSSSTSTALSDAEDNSGGSGGKGNKSEKKTGSMIGSGDIVVMKSAEDPTAKNQFRFTSSMTMANTDNTRVKGVLVNFTSVVNNTNITFYKAWVFKKSKLTFIAANSSMMNFEKDFFNTTTTVLSKRYKGNWKKLTTMGGLNYTAGKYGDKSFMNLSAIGGGFYSYNISSKISGSVLIIGVYSPFTQFYDGRWWESSTLIVPYSTWDYKLTKTFKFNVSFSGVYEMNKSMLNYQVLTGGKIMF